MKEFDVICCGYINPCICCRVKSIPELGKHNHYTNRFISIGADAAIVASTLASWGLRVGLIGYSLGLDFLGLYTYELITNYGVKCLFQLNSKLRTPFEIIVSDDDDQRIWFSDDINDYDIDESNIDFSYLENAKIIYLDWYAGDILQRAFRISLERKIPIFVNMGQTGIHHIEENSFFYQASYLQAHTEYELNIPNMKRVLKEMNLFDSNMTIYMTKDKDGVICKDNSSLYKVVPPKTTVTDTNGAGATFSAGCIYSKIKGFNINQELKFAVRTATLKCTTNGILDFLDEEQMNNLIIDFFQNDIQTN